MRILIIEDDERLTRVMARVLRQERFDVDLAHDGETGLDQALTGIYDALVVDWMLPRRDGLDIIQELRRAGLATPVLMLTARGELPERVRGLNAGADDYLPKPFHFDELLARMRALIRRGGAERLEVLRFGEIQMDRLRHRVEIGSHVLDLTAKEFQLLEYFLLHPEEVVRRTTLLEKVWDMHFDPESNVVDVHVGNLRRKLKRCTSAQVIDTVRGVGFALRHANAETVSSNNGD